MPLSTETKLKYQAPSSIIYNSLRYHTNLNVPSTPTIISPYIPIYRGTNGGTPNSSFMSPVLDPRSACSNGTTPYDSDNPYFYFKSPKARLYGVRIVSNISAAATIVNNGGGFLTAGFKEAGSQYHNIGVVYYNTATGTHNEFGYSSGSLFLISQTGTINYSAYVDQAFTPHFITNTVNGYLEGAVYMNAGDYLLFEELWYFTKYYFYNSGNDATSTYALPNAGVDYYIDIYEITERV